MTFRCLARGRRFGAVLALLALLALASGCVQQANGALAPAPPPTPDAQILSAVWSAGR